MGCTYATRGHASDSARPCVRPVALDPRLFWSVQDGVCIQVLATGRRGHIVSSRQDGGGIELTVELEGVGRRAFRPDEVRPVPPQIVSARDVWS